MAAAKIVVAKIIENGITIGFFELFGSVLFGSMKSLQYSDEGIVLTRSVRFRQFWP